MLKRILLAHGVISAIFHRYISPAFNGIGLLFLHSIVSLGMALDHLFFPSLRKVTIKKPVVVAGNSRSGTTFLRRFLVDNGFGAGLRIWKMMFPSLTLQVLIKSLLPLLEKFSPARHHSVTAHKTCLTDIETDDASLLFRFWNIPEKKRKHFINRLYHAFLDLSMRFYEDYSQGSIHKDNVMIVPFPRIMEDFDNLMDEILQFVGRNQLQGF